MGLGVHFGVTADLERVCFLDAAVPLAGKQEPLPERGAAQGFGRACGAPCLVTHALHLSGILSAMSLGATGR